MPGNESLYFWIDYKQEGETRVLLSLVQGRLDEPTPTVVPNDEMVEGVSNDEAAGLCAPPPLVVSTSMKPEDSELVPPQETPETVTVEQGGATAARASLEEDHETTTAAASSSNADADDLIDLEAAVAFARNKAYHELKTMQLQQEQLSKSFDSTACESLPSSDESFDYDSPSSTVLAGSDDNVQDGAAVRLASQKGESTKERSSSSNMQDPSKHSRRAVLLVLSVVCLIILLPVLIIDLPKRATTTAPSPDQASSLPTSSSLGSTVSSPSTSPTMSPMMASPMSSLFPPAPPTTSSSPTKSPMSPSPPSKPSSVQLLATGVARYVPGKLSHRDDQLMLSQGLSAKIIAKANMFVEFPSKGTKSKIRSHKLFDAGATFANTRGDYENIDGSWTYVSNAEVEDGKGGVGAFIFDAKGNVIDYKMLLTKTSKNCGGGKTPWNAWISCEEVNGGRCYQVDPMGQRESKMITVGEETNGGKFESFAYWIRDRSKPQFFVTEDDDTSTVRRFIPDDPDWSDPWQMLLGRGSTTYLMLNPSSMTFSWTNDVDKARINGGRYFPGSEGINQFGDKLYFVTKTLKKMYTLDLRKGTYREQSTKIGRFDGQPDQIVRTANGGPSGTLYFTQDSDNTCGIAAQNANGMYTIANTMRRGEDETAGLAFSPSGKHLYFAMQKIGILYEITRDDGLGFDEEPSDIVYEKRSNSD